MGRNSLLQKYDAILVLFYQDPRLIIIDNIELSIMQPCT